MNLKPRIAVYAAALWWGSLTAIGFIAVPLLFAHLATPAIAGQMAAKLFTAQTWVSVGCGMLLLLNARLEGWVLGGMILSLLVEFGVAPRIVAKQDLALWHSVGSAMYLVQWVCAAVLVWKLPERYPREGGDPEGATREIDAAASSGFPPARE